MEDDELNDYATTLKEKLIGCYQNVMLMRQEVAANRFDLVVNFPRFRKNLDDEWSAIVATGFQSEILSRAISLLPQDVSFSSVSQFITAFRAFANDVESNVTVFLVTINPTSKRPEFVTPIAANIKTALTNRINAIIATVS